MENESVTQKLIGFGEFRRNTATHRDDLKTKVSFERTNKYFSSTLYSAV